MFECTPDESVDNPLGIIHGGLVCTVADTVAGCAVQTTLEAWIGYTSIDITVNYLRGHPAERHAIAMRWAISQRSQSPGVCGRSATA